MIYDLALAFCLSVLVAVIGITRCRSLIGVDEVISGIDVTCTTLEEMTVGTVAVGTGDGDAHCRCEWSLCLLAAI